MAGSIDGIRPGCDLGGCPASAGSGRRDQRQATGRSNNFGATAGGAIKIPKIYDGKDKLFFFGSYNGIYQSKAETTDAVNRSVPAPEWLTGDFSEHGGHSGAFSRIGSMSLCLHSLQVQRTRWSRCAVRTPQIRSDATGKVHESTRRQTTRDRIQRGVA